MFRYRVYRVAAHARTLGAEGQVVCAVVDLRFEAVAVPARVLAIPSEIS